MPSTPRSMKTPQMANSRKNSPANATRDMVAHNGHPSGSFRPPFLLDKDGDGDLPTNVSRVDQLCGLPPECLNHDDVHKPSRHLHDQGNECGCNLSPMACSVGLISVVELLERLSFCGTHCAQALHLTGVCSANWNAGLSSVDAASCHFQLARPGHGRLVLREADARGEQVLGQRVLLQSSHLHCEHIDFQWPANNWLAGSCTNQLLGAASHQSC